jgi:beta-lactam-binding protein with PASTA domain
VRVASGDVEVPDLSGLPESAAAEMLRAAGFAFDTRRAQSSTVPAGQAIEARPGAHAVLPGGSNIVLVISQGT